MVLDKRHYVERFINNRPGIYRGLTRVGRNLELKREPVCLKCGCTRGESDESVFCYGGATDIELTQLFTCSECKTISRICYLGEKTIKAEIVNGVM